MGTRGWQSGCFLGLPRSGPQWWSWMGRFGFPERDLFDTDGRSTGRGRSMNMEEKKFLIYLTWSCRLQLHRFTSQRLEESATTGSVRAPGPYLEESNVPRKRGGTTTIKYPASFPGSCQISNFLGHFGDSTCPRWELFTRVYINSTVTRSLNKGLQIICLRIDMTV